MVSQTIRNFGKVRDAVEIPDLVAIQRKSFDRFLQREAVATRRACVGLESLFQEIFPIESYDKNMNLEYLYYELESPHYTPMQCRQLRLTYGYPLKVHCRLKTKKSEDSTEQAIYLGEIPIMIGGGEFIINGAVRVIVSQLHRSPGVDFLIESKEGDRVLHGGRIIPERGSWIEIGVTHKDVLAVKIDQSSKIPATVFLRAINPDYGTTDEILRLFGAVPLELLFPAVVEVGIVEIIIAPIIRPLPDSAAAVNQNLPEPSILRPERIIITQMPLTENTSLIPPGAEHIRNSRLMRAEQRPAHNRMPYAGLRRIMPRHQRRTRRRTSRIHMKICQPNALAVQLVQIRRINHLIAEAVKIAVTLIVRHYQDNVGPLALAFRSSASRCTTGQQSRPRRCNTRLLQETAPIQPYPAFRFLFGQSP